MINKVAIRIIALCLIPILLLPIPIIFNTKMGRCGYVLLLMMIFWMSELINLTVTSLIPMFLFPLMGILDSEKVSMKYMTNTGMLFLGGMIIAKSIEHCNLHRRICLLCFKYFGVKGPRLILSFMLPCWFMSMWISNIAATAMVYSIANGMFQELTSSSPQIDSIEETKGNENNSDSYDNISERSKLLLDTSDHHSDNDHQGTHQYANLDAQDSCHLRNAIPKNLEKAICLSIAYASTCGGIGTLIGTGPNVILYGLVNDRYGDKTALNFGSYMLYGVPISFLCLTASWIVICFNFLGFRSIWSYSMSHKQSERVQNFINQRYQSLGRIKFGECSCIFWIGFLIISLVTRHPGVPLWDLWFQFAGPNGTYISYATDTQPVMFVAFILMVWPNENIFNKSFWTDSKTKYFPVLPWTVVQKELPWNVIILVGGGFALADGLKSSGLSDFLGEQITSFTTLPQWLLVLVVVSVVCFITEFVSNNVMATIIIPILLSIAECNSSFNPLIIVIPAAVASSLAFCLPISTPPNALVYSEGRVSITDMMRTGILLNLFGIVIVFIVTMLYAESLFPFTNNQPCNSTSIHKL